MQKIFSFFIKFFAINCYTPYILYIFISGTICAAHAPARATRAAHLRQSEALPDAAHGNVSARTGKGQARIRPGGRSFGHIAGANRNQAPDRLSHSGKPAAQIVGFNAGNAFPESQIVAAYMWGNYNNVAGNLPCRVFSAATRSEIHAARNGYNEPGRMQELSSAASSCMRGKKRYGIVDGKQHRKAAHDQHPLHQSVNPAPARK